VAIPLGSSSAAPVISPGPSAVHKVRKDRARLVMLAPSLIGIAAAYSVPTNMQFLDLNGSSETANTRRPADGRLIAGIFRTWPVRKLH
jgi:hypothetical protein